MTEIMSTEQMRKAFEAWAKKNYTTPKLRRRGEFDYIDVQTAVAFDAWKAATLAERERIAKKCGAADKSTHPADLADEIRKGGTP